VPALWPALAAGAASGLLISLANPPADVGPLAFVGLIPLLWILRAARPRRGALLGLVFGLVYWGVLMYWLLPFGLIAWLPLVVSQSAYTGLFGLLMPLLWRNRRLVRSAVAAAALWTALDWARGTWPVGGFTWGMLGNTQHADGFLLPLASVTGVWGITFVVVLVNALIMVALSRVRARWSFSAGLVAVALGAVVAPALIPVAAADGGPGLEVAVVQGNVPLALAHDRLLQTAAVGESHIRLHRTLAARAPDLAVWPENALADDPAVDVQLGRDVSGAIGSVGAATLVGAIREAPGERFYNQVLQYSGDGRILSRYTKNHLVPFGEYVPFHSILGWTQRYRRGNADLARGHDITLFRVDGVVVGTPICFENAFPDLFRRFVAKGADLMVVSTNDSSFLFSPASREHVIMSQLRAVETGRWVVHAAVSGESAVVDPDGRVVTRTGLFERTILRATVPGVTSRTLYVRWGDWFPWTCGISALLLMAGAWRRRRRSGGSPPAGEGPQHVDGSAGESSADQEAPMPISGGAEPRVLVILPTYNERATIGTVLGGVMDAGANVEVLVVDDGSPDGTAEVVEALAAETTRVAMIRRAGKQGLASAYLAGFRKALEDGYDVVVEMDADLSHRPEDLPALLEGAVTNDLTIGSRYVSGGSVSNWSRARLALSRAGNAYARLALGLPVADATSGFRAYRRPALEALLAGGIHSEGYAFQVELVYRAWRSGFSVAEVPITFREREHGRSKISRRIVAEALVKVTQWAIRDRFRGRRRIR
jgi:apolipoprotein N-acyltransferase